MGEHDGEWRPGAPLPGNTPEPQENPIGEVIRKARPGKKDDKAGKTRKGKDAKSQMYVEHEGRLCRVVNGSEQPLCNFTARITEEILIDDGGEECRLTLIIAGRLANGQELPNIDVSAATFAGMAWVTSSAWGSRAIVYAGTSTKDHLRTAIQTLSEAPRRTVYGHTGWRRINERWRYLHAAGALGAEGNQADVEVNPGAGHMQQFRLPDPPTGEALHVAIRASLELMNLAPGKPEVGALLLACIYRAPTASIHAIDHGAFLVGYTGSRKSEAAALVQAHFGQGFNARSFPANWTDTPGALEQKAHAAADAVMVIDDFKPTGTRSDVDAMHQKAEKVFRAAGNQSGRGRLPSARLHPGHRGRHPARTVPAGAPHHRRLEPGCRRSPQGRRGPGQAHRAARPRQERNPGCRHGGLCAMAGPAD